MNFFFFNICIACKYVTNGIATTQIFPLAIFKSARFNRKVIYINLIILPSISLKILSLNFVV